ncbi:penicillin-binding protein 2 [Gilvimarinus sp. SDUM040013]|uniref:Peptidoglycan D,D-transpeptidase MrdA n=1 Tax=Gilvimarinus gilvus TaxID=3058038 RepID=A0ABU4RWK9_9GAMM|nr:penicillin-binding protein 2 [Gilvimarinus sp. SDUM040013]MDO3385286.1 penicillin-binding protein 2 [Gilvimarinus sp. SDUM040013]MDX6849269.1 penicillin-binding protein 2 [Gilvimarinus sp. SDUM040013]
MSEARHFKDHHREAKIFVARAIFTALAIVLLTGMLLVRFYSLQVTHHQDYVTQSDRNRVHVLPISPTRGLIYDRNGELLAENRASYTLSIVHERVEDLGQTLDTLGDLVDISANDIEKFNDQLRQKRRPFDPVPLRYNLNEEEIAHLAVNEYRLDGVEVHAQLVRNYTHGELYAHTLGYVGRISEKELAGFDEDTYQKYSGTHSIGKIGLEREYESMLLGDVGYQNVETNARGRVLRVLDSRDPKPGQDLVLHMDTEVQREAHAALDGRRGAVVAIDVATGGVIAAVSAPSFDANLFVTGISFKDYRLLNQSRDLPLFNRFLQGQYPPGSTIKPVVGMAGLHHNVITPQDTIYDPGYYRLGNDKRLYRDWKRRGHGTKVDLLQAIAESCDTYFYDLGHNLGIDDLHSFGSQFGLGDKSGIDIPSERRGLWPSRAWKRGARGLAWYPGDTLNVSIGQGDVLATPLQLAVMTATLASRGRHFRPQLVASIGGQEVAPTLVEQVEVAPEHWETILNAMHEVVHGLHGTAKSINRGADYEMAGKTGTAQVVAIAQGEEYDSEALSERNRDHALFVGYAPFEQPQIAVAVILENAESSSSAAQISRRVFDVWLNRENN